MHTNAKRDSDFPATSIGRSSGSRTHLHAHAHTASSSSPHEAHAHPLLSPGRPSSPTPSERSLSLSASTAPNAHANGGTSSLGPQKYIPYTPRQRVTPTTTTTTVHPSTVSPQHGPHHGGGGLGDATSKLQLMHLKAAAQGVGLDSGTLGWSMLEKLVDGESHSEGEWTEVWSAITSGKATLLLPLESAHTHEKITADFLKDHIVLCDGPSRKNASIVTLSGLRGILEEETLTFRSTLNTHSKLFHDLLAPATRTTALSLLPPLPLPLSPSESIPSSTAPSSSSAATIPISSYATSAYPHFTVPSYSSSLPLPPRSSQTPNTKPPLPPRPAKHPASGSTSTITTATTATTASTTSRIPNPFASLFGGGSSSGSSTSKSTSTPAAPAQTLLIPPSPPTSLRSLESTATDTHPSSGVVVEISAFTIDRRIIRKEVAKEVNKALKNELKGSLAAVSSPPSGEAGAGRGGAAGSIPIPIPGWVVERVHELTKDWYPFINVKKPSSGGVGSPLKKTSSSGSGSSKEAGDEKGWVVNALEEETPEDVAQTLQDFYFTLEQDMRAGGTPFLSRRKERERDRERREKEKERERDKEKEEKHREENGGDGEGEEDAQDREKRVSERLEGESRIREVMEAVERAVTSLFYDRLFMQATTDDASHDEALSNRIAALNMLDLGLGHLGIQVGSGSSAGNDEDAEGDEDDEDEETEVDVVVKACGEMLSQLDTCRSPADKAAILVAAHKVVVDGLSRLPPIRLISENDNDHDNNDDRKDREEEEEEAELKTAKPTSSTFAEAAASQQRPQPKTKKVDGSSNEPSQSAAQAEAAASETTTLVPEETSAAATEAVPSKPKAPPPPPLPLDKPTPPTTSTQPHLSPIHPKRKPKTDPTPVSGDVLLPLIIFSVVKSNPPHLVSNLLFTQRFRNQSVGGQESYCLINLMAVAEFLENVDMAGLGLGEVDKVVSTADLTPIPLTRSPVTAETPLEPTDGLHGSLRGRVGQIGQQVDAIADSANKVISGVVDSSFGILRSFMPGADPTKSPALSGSGSGRLTPGAAAAAAGGTPGSLPKTGSGGFGLLRRESGFSIASLAASLPVSIPGRARSSVGGTGAGEEAGQQLVAVSRPSSVRSFKLRSGKPLRVKVGGSDDEDGEEEEDGSESVDEYDRDRDHDGESEEGSNVSGDEEEEDESNAEDGEEYIAGGGAGQGDTRSIRSFESMLSASRQGQGKGGRGANKSKMSKARKSLSDRLASVSALAGRKTSPPPTSRRSSLLPRPTRGSPPASSSRAASPSSVQAPLNLNQTQLHLPPPRQRFMECTADDLRLSEVGELLKEYRRLVEGVRAIGGFDE